MLVAYYCLAFISFADQILYGKFTDQLLNIIKIFTFRSVPSYGEFFIPFLFFSIIIIPFHRRLYLLTKKPFKAMATALVIFGLGTALYSLKIPEFLSPWTAIFFGHDNVYRFPLMQYTPIFMAGLIWGKYLIENPEYRAKQLSAKLAALYSACALVVISIPYLTFKMPLGTLFDRWPPTIPFLLVGILFIFVILYFIFINKELKKHAFSHDLLLLLGQNALALYWTHIVILKLFRLSGGTAISSSIIVLGLFCILLITSLAISTFVPFNFSYHLTFIRENNGKPFRHIEHNELPTIYGLSEDVSHKTKFHFRISYTLIAIVVFAFSTSLYPAAKERILSIKNTPIENATWWNDDYSYKKTLKIENDNTFSILKKGSQIKITFNHHELVNEGKSQNNGNDIQVVYYNGKKSEAICRTNENSWDSAQTFFTFELQENILPKDFSNRYFLYYGNPLAESINTKEESSHTVNIITGLLGDEEKHPNYISINQHWFLKPDSVTKNDPLIISLPNDKKNINSAEYEIANTTLKGSLASSINDTNFYEGIVDVSSLVPGTYRIKATFYDFSGKVYTSQNIGFNVSYPLYVAWTWDWEGYDVNESYLSKMTELSKNHEISLTHFFNPRLYTPGVMSQERINYLTNWVKNRRDNLGEEIDFHLHMFPDYVTACGVTAKDSPRWDYYKDGYDILTTAYNYEEMLALTKCGLNLFEQNGLGMPLAYRAGGWYANLETLRAVQDAGIKVDSSARTAYKFGSRQAEGFWNVDPKTKPYYPSLSDQNFANPSPRLSLLEIPNNGADSYKFSAKQMIDRFDINYQTKYLTEPQQITYLSHPHWFNNAEQQRVDQLFSYIDQYKYQNDSGPVRYVLTRDIYEVFK